MVEMDQVCREREMVGHVQMGFQDWDGGVVNRALVA
jgi:hypothetical protein